MDEEELQDALEDEPIVEEEPIEQEETDEWGNPAGTEYDDEGEPIDPGTEPEPEPVAVAPTPRTPPAFSVAPVLSAEDREYAEALFTPQQLQFIEGYTARQVAAVQQSFSAANFSIEETLSGASSEYRAMMAPRLSAAVANMVPAQRAHAGVGRAALLIALDNESQETGEPIWEVIARHSQLRGGASPAPKPRAVIAPKPAATRAPSPSNSGNRPAARSTASGASSNTKLIARTMGISVREAETLGLE